MGGGGELEFKKPGSMNCDLNRLLLYTPMNEKSIIWTFISEFLNTSIIQSRTKFRGEEGRAIFYIVL